MKRIESLVLHPNSLWTPIKYVLKNDRSHYECKCSCGKIKTIRLTRLENGESLSCGHRTKELHTTHGMSQSKIYTVWAGMLQRCRDSNTDAYQNYGARGIRVCDRWLKFENFFADMGDIPFKGATVDRINNEGNYEPNNCRWATAEIQANNRRSNCLIKIGEKTDTLANWCKRYKMSQNLVQQRIVRDKWEPYKALTTPKFRR